MNQYILHKNENGGVAICTPSSEALETYTILEIAIKDTPTGQPFWIVDENEIPDDGAFFDAWEFDNEALGEPDGYGINYEDWVKEYKK